MKPQIPGLLPGWQREVNGHIHASTFYAHRASSFLSGDQCAPATSPEDLPLLK